MIREAAAQNLKDLTALFGSKWACEYLIPSIEDIRHHPSYLRRLTAVQACSRMAVEMEPEVASTEILPMVLDMATDLVSNIRSLQIDLTILSSTNCALLARVGTKYPVQCGKGTG